MKKTATLTLVLLVSLVSAQSEIEGIRNTVMNYINGSSYNDPELIETAFYEEADMFLSKEGQDIFIMKPKKYAESFQNRTKGEFNGREGTIMAIDFANDIATAKAEIKIPARDLLYVDLFLLKKISGKWKIISKAATQLK